MIDWLVMQTALASLFILLLILIKKPALSYMSAKGVYQIWLVLPISLLLSVLPIWNEMPTNMSSFIVTAGVKRAELSQSLMEIEDVLLLFWAVGVSVVLMSFIVTHLQYMRSLALKPVSLTELDSNDYKAQIDDLLVFSSGKISSPFIAGILKPYLVLPSDFSCRFSNSQQALMIKHELTHKQRGDLTWNLLAQSILVVFWFNPLSWVGYRLFRHVQELSCDQQVLVARNKSQRVDYAKAMLLCTHPQAQMSFNLLHYGVRTDMQERIENLQKQKSVSVWRSLTCGIALVISLFVFNSATVLAGNQNKEVAPVMRVEPVYPPNAAKEGVEGAVLLSFDIETDGSVSNVKVVEAKPKGIFNRSAKIALRQWVYQQPSVKMSNVLVQLDYLLSEESQTVALFNEKKETEKIVVSH